MKTTDKHFARYLSAISYGFALFLAIGAASAATLNEPFTLSSENGVLDILMIAKAAPIHTLPSAPVGWVYEICKRPASNLEACPPGSSAPNPYGGTLLRLGQGDTLRIHFVNQLPPVTDSDHAAEPGHEFLELNPTNLHTHGMLVAPRQPSTSNPTYGDNVFVLTFNSLNGKPTVSPHMHSDIRYDFTDYEIKIPASHPSGLFWFHPHAHGIALNQVSAGLGGIITVGNPADYICKDAACASAISQIGVRHIVLKDTQILANGKMQTQEDPDFCLPARAPGEAPRQGSCAGQNNMSGGPSYSGGSWFFTLNGQAYPTIPIQSGGGEIWRITNESGSVTYDLNLWNPKQGRNMIFQVLSLDGVSVSPTPGMSDKQKAEISGGKFVPEACPGSIEDDTSSDEALCTRRLHMMPSSRAEVWVAYRDSKDKLASPPNGSYGVFRTSGYQTGQDGDFWPAVDLARVDFRASSLDDRIPEKLKVKGDAVTMLAPTALSSSMFASNQAVAADASCKPLPPGHMRRIFFSVPTNNMDAFGLAYEEVDEQGRVVGKPVTDVTPFDPMQPTICVPLGPGNTPVTERWQLVNVAVEDHNFHIHQVKFRVLSQDEVGGTVLPGQIAGKGVVLDNVPLPHANGVCGNNPPNDLSNPIDDWRGGLCTASPITVEIPFSIAGDFVYHCHILEHEDGGMMARIRVRPTK